MTGPAGAGARPDHTTTIQQQTRQENDMDRTHEIDRPVDQAAQGPTPPVVDWPTESAVAADPASTRQTAPAGWAALSRKPVALALAGVVLAATTFLGGLAVGRATAGGADAGTQQGGFGGRGFGGPGGPGGQQGQQGQGTVPNQQGQGTVPNQQGTTQGQGGTTTS